MTPKDVNRLTEGQNSQGFTFRVGNVHKPQDKPFPRSGENMSLREFSEYISEMAKRLDGIRDLASYLEVNPGLIWRVINGHESPTVRKAADIPIHPKRTRLNIDVTPELKTRYDELCRQHGMTRLEMLRELMTFYDLEE